MSAPQDNPAVAGRIRPQPRPTEALREPVRPEVPLRLYGRPFAATKELLEEGMNCLFLVRRLEKRAVANTLETTEGMAELEKSAELVVAALKRMRICIDAVGQSVDDTRGLAIDLLNSTNDHDIGDYPAAMQLTAARRRAAQIPESNTL